MTILNGVLVALVIGALIAVVVLSYNRLYRHEGDGGHTAGSRTNTAQSNTTGGNNNNNNSNTPMSAAAAAAAAAKPASKSASARRADPVSSTAPNPALSRKTESKTKTTGDCPGGTYDKFGVCDKSGRSKITAPTEGAGATNGAASTDLEREIDKIKTATKPKTSVEAKPPVAFGVNKKSAANDAETPAIFGHSCRLMMDRYGVVPSKTFGTAPKWAQDWWQAKGAYKGRSAVDERLRPCDPKPVASRCRYAYADCNRTADGGGGCSGARLDAAISCGPKTMNGDMCQKLSESDCSSKTDNGCRVYK